MRYLLLLATFGMCLTGFAQAKKPVKKPVIPFQVISSSVKYRILKQTTKTRQSLDTSFYLQANYRLSILPKDTVLIETFSINKPVYIPVAEPLFRNVFSGLNKGDSAEIIVDAAVFFKESFKQELPAFVKAGSNIRFLLKVVDVYNPETLRDLANKQKIELIKKDSLEKEKYLAKLTGLKKTVEGIYYATTKEGTGRAVKKGDKVQVAYKGMFLNGDIFDQSLKNYFEVNVGANSVIQGWEIMLENMNEGEKVTAVIPPVLAYGEGGSGIIPPYTTLVFEMEVVKIVE